MTGLEGVTHALTLVCPWAVLVVEGPKSIENRSWKPPAWVVGKRIAIHAGKKADLVSGAGQVFNAGASVGLWPNDSAAWKFREIRGAIIGTAVVAGFVTDARTLSPSQRPWFFGPIGWVLEDRQALAEPVPCRGALGLWKINESITAGSNGVTNGRT